MRGLAPFFFGGRVAGTGCDYYCMLCLLLADILSYIYSYLIFGPPPQLKAFPADVAQVEDSRDALSENKTFHAICTFEWREKSGKEKGARSREQQRQQVRV